MQRTPNKCWLALAALQLMMLSMSTNPTNPRNPSEFLPRARGEGHAPRAPAIHLRQGRGRGPRHGRVLPPNLPLPKTGHTVNRTKGAAQQWAHRLTDDHGNVMSSAARRVMRDPPTSEHIIEIVTFKGRVSRDACAAGADAQLLRER